VPPAVVGKSGVKHRLVLPASGAGDINTGRSERRMDSFDLEPRYSTSQFETDKPEYELKVS